MTPNYWVTGAGKCAQSALVHQISRATGYAVWGHSKRFPYSHQPNHVVHTNQVPVPQLPYEQYTCVLVVRRNVLLQIMESWVDEKRVNITLQQAAPAFSDYLNQLHTRIQLATSPQWHTRSVVHTEDLLADPVGIMRSTFDLNSSVPLQPNLNQLKPQVQLTHYTQLREELPRLFQKEFEQINSALKVYLNRQS